MKRMLNIRDLRVWFPVRMGLLSSLAGGEPKHVRAVDDISFDVGRGEVFCLVGESGCGKTTTGKALLRLNDPTSGSIFFDVPDDDWDRLSVMRTRLEELRPIVANLSTESRVKARAEWDALRGMEKRLARIRNPRGMAGRQRRLLWLDRTIRFLEGRGEALREGQDSAIKRALSRDRRELEQLKTLGPWFTPRRARRLDRLEQDLKEAKYKLLRAEVTNLRAKRPARVVRGIERRIARMKDHAETGDPQTLRRIEAFERSLVEKQERLTQLELSNVTTELDRLRAERAAMKPRETEESEAEIRDLETTIAQARERGGPGLEALQLEAEVEELRDRYDLATWGVKTKFTYLRRRGRRKEYKRRMRGLRRRMQIIYQDPYESLNPKLSIFDTVAEPLLANKIIATQAETEAVVAKALEDVGLRPASEFMFRYPHELSGGQRQRVGIASALVVDPDFIVADEPVSMLDASVRTEILALLLDLKKRRDLTYLFITHDLGLAWILADRIAVMYLGRVVETGEGREIIQNPRHPYTKALISVVPSPNPSVHREKTILRGERPNPVDIPAGCRFHPRCPMAVGICGWDSDEVRAELLKLLQEDREGHAEARSVDDVAADAPFALTLKTSGPEAVEAYLRKRIQAAALGRPALGAIRTMHVGPGVLHLGLHQPVEPPLRAITDKVSAACHLLEPERAESEMIAVTK